MNECFRCGEPASLLAEHEWVTRPVCPGCAWSMVDVSGGILQEPGEWSNPVEESDGCRRLMGEVGPEDCARVLLAAASVASVMARRLDKRDLARLLRILGYRDQDDRDPRCGRCDRRITNKLGCACG